MNPSDEATVRVLVVYEDSYRSYGETMAEAVRSLKPGAEVSPVQARELASEVDRFDPHLVVCNRPNAVDPGGRVAWVQLSDDPDEPSEFCLGGRRWGALNPGLGEVLEILGGTEGLLREGGELGGC
jgi:hypothetical protein